jgi:hypothetical protein
MNKPDKLSILIILAALGSLLLSACGPSKPAATPTVDVKLIQTSVVSTFAAGMTQTALSMPTNTPTNTPTASPTATLATITPFKTSSGGIVPTSAVSCYGLVLESETIPDNTAMLPGQTFTKTWRVKNSGTCAWDIGFKFIFISGEAMGGTTQTLSAAVAPGAKLDISIPMTAPSKSGTMTGYWKMSTTSGAFFNNDVFVKINVGSATPTATGTPPTATPTGPTATANPLFDVAFDSAIDCGGGSWAIKFKVTNTGTLTWESNQVAVTDGTTAESVSIDRNNFPDFGAGCAVSSRAANLAGAASGFTASNDLSASPSGHSITATIKVCSQDDLAGTCLDKTITFPVP